MIDRLVSPQELVTHLLEADEPPPYGPGDVAVFTAIKNPSGKVEIGDVDIATERVKIKILDPIYNYEPGTILTVSFCDVEPLKPPPDDREAEKQNQGRERAAN